LDLLLVDANLDITMSEDGAMVATGPTNSSDEASYAASSTSPTTAPLRKASTVPTLESFVMRTTPTGGVRKVVVIGAGVIGLTVAVHIQDHGFQTTIVAKDLPGPFEEMDSQDHLNYTSPWAGAHNRWVLPPSTQQEQDEHTFATETFLELENLVKDGKDVEAGITFLPGVEYFEDPPEKCAELEEKWMEGLKGRVLDQKELPEGVKWGCVYPTWCINPMRYCQYLLRRFKQRGGVVVQKTLADPEEVFAMDDGVYMAVNCTGYGLSKDDPDKYIMRGELRSIFTSVSLSSTKTGTGQTCLVANKCDRTITRQNKDGTWTFCVPRGFGGGTVIGGTKEPNDWYPYPREETRKELLEKFKTTYPEILKDGEDFKVIRDIVGRRPMRKGGYRIEAVKVLPDKSLIHAYGFGGRGFELSWGVAGEVYRLLHHVDPWTGMNPTKQLEIVV
jgi:D-amino-acid oxidase